MGSLENIFSEENLAEYSKACLDLALDIPAVFKEKKMDTLVIPSRGAVPFFLGMKYALGRIAELFGEHVDFYENMGVQKNLVPLLPKHSRKRRGELEGKLVRVLLAPFTADLNLGKFDAEENTDEYVEKTRKYWANVTAAIFKSPEKRRNDPYFKSFVDVVLRDIEGREDIARTYDTFPTIERFGIMDTVISGRASNHILQAFEELAKRTGNPDLNPYAFLIVDEKGRKLRYDFKRYLDRKEREGKAKKYYVPRIVSEDENASLLGVGAVVYPSVMRASKNLTHGMREFFVGAGSWRLDTELGPSNPHVVNFHRFMNLIRTGVDLALVREYGGTQEQIETEQERFGAERHGFLAHAYKNKLMKEGTDVAHVLREVRYPAQAPYETSSFVLHVPFSDSSTARIMNSLTDIPGVGKESRIIRLPQKKRR